VPVIEVVLPANAPLIKPYMVDPDRVMAKWFHVLAVTVALDNVIVPTPKYSRLIVRDVFIAA